MRSTQFLSAIRLFCLAPAASFALLAACSGGGSSSAASYESPANPALNKEIETSGIDPLVGRWVLDLKASQPAKDGSRKPDSVLGRTVLLTRDGSIVIDSSRGSTPRRGSWKRLGAGLKVTLDPPPTVMNAVFDCMVTGADMRLSGPDGLTLVYKRDSLLAGNGPAPAGGADAPGEQAPPPR